MYKDLICLPTNYVLLIIIMIVSFFCLYLYEKKNTYKEPNINSKNSKIPELDIQPVNYQKMPSEIEMKLYLNRRDENVLYNDFYPPERREPSYQYPSRYIRNNLNIPTRGIPDNYQLLGLILRDNTETAYKLFGRQLYPGSTQYEYYAQGVMHHNDVKVPLKVRGDKEIEDNQVIHIPGTDSTKGQFKVKLYNFDAPRYM
jgi:hypothetical protein